MLVVIIEIWPGGDEQRKRRLGVATIVNDGKGTEEIANYQFEIFKGPELGSRNRSVWKRGKIQGFARRMLGPWDLLYRGLKQTVKSRNDNE